MKCEKKDCYFYRDYFSENCNFNSDLALRCLENNHLHYHGIFDKKESNNDVTKCDNINHPSHYIQYKKEVIDIIKDCLTDEEFKGYLKGNIIKYRMRAGLKNDRDEDLKKSNWYQDKLEAIK